MMRYTIVIVNECGEVKYYVSNIGEKMAEEVLANHPEWCCRCIEVEED